jgi:1-acyl-sn-glycerol-3-phosphate acyltransferase
MGVAVLFVMLWMNTEVPGRPKAFAPNEAFFDFISANGRSYYAPAELRGALDKIKPGKNMFAVHPHGMLTAGWTWNMFWNTKLHELAAGSGRIGFLLDEGLRLKMPTFRLMCDWAERKNFYAAAATKKAIKEGMQRGDALAILPGGFQEAVLCQFGKDKVYVKKRQGFVKYCLQGGYRITPVYTFGESDTYWTFTGLLKPRMWLAKNNIPAAAPFGNPLCPVLPRAGVSLITYVGEAIELPQIAEPTTEEINTWHGKYMQGLQDLFEKYKAEAGRPDAKLEIF